MGIPADLSRLQLPKLVPQHLVHDQLALRHDQACISAMIGRNKFEVKLATRKIPSIESKVSRTSAHKRLQVIRSQVEIWRSRSGPFTPQSSLTSFSAHMSL